MVVCNLHTEFDIKRPEAHSLGVDKWTLIFEEIVCFWTK